jgi:hypothetical protein
MLPQQSGSLIGGCCHGGPPSPPQSRRGWEIAAGALSIGVWILMPKCPVCLAAHVALWTGLGLSFAEATYFRWSLLSLSGVLLLYLIAKRIGARWLGRDRGPASIKIENSRSDIIDDAGAGAE